MDDALISVIVPTYNRAYCICRAIDSVRNQTYRNWEVVLVDDGSTDDTAALIASTYGDDARIRYMSQLNGGVSAARNKGICESRGEYVAFLDSDDQWKPWKLEIQLACFRALPNVGMVWTNFEAVDSSGTVVNERYLTTMYGAYHYFPTFESLFGQSQPLNEVIHSVKGFGSGTRVYTGNIYRSMLRGSLVHTSTVMMSRARVEIVKEFDNSLSLSGEDYEFHFRTCKLGDVCYVDISSAVYQLDYEDRLTRNSKAMALNFLRTIEAVIVRESGTGEFSPGVIEEVLAGAHGWIAEELLKEKDYMGIRRHSLLSLRHKKWQPRQFMLFGIASAPRSLAEALLKSYHEGKSMITGGKGRK